MCLYTWEQAISTQLNTWLGYLLIFVCYNTPFASTPFAILHWYVFMCMYVYIYIYMYRYTYMIRLRLLNVRHYIVLYYCIFMYRIWCYTIVLGGSGRRHVRRRRAPGREIRGLLTKHDMQIHLKLSDMLPLHLGNPP